MVLMGSSIVTKRLFKILTGVGCGWNGWIFLGMNYQYMIFFFVTDILDIPWKMYENELRKIKTKQKQKQKFFSRTVMQFHFFNTAYQKCNMHHHAILSQTIHGSPNKSGYNNLHLCNNLQFFDIQVYIIFAIWVNNFVWHNFKFLLKIKCALPPTYFGHCTAAIRAQYRDLPAN